ncbi:MAG: leucine-rich repeat domain-containing protein [Candidatus Methanomethylophilaceae archaeon]|nr:leucine-rich repeat domain-containing protein [Candidatus Methanomethylophilaceae archaeon]
MDRVGRFRELFKIEGERLDPARMPAMMRFGGFGEKDAYLVESAVRVSPESFMASLSDPDADRAGDAAASLQIPEAMSVISDMRAALGLPPLRTAKKPADRGGLFRDMFDKLGRRSLADGSMARWGFRPEDVMMVRYIARCRPRDLETMAWDPDCRVASRAADSIAWATSLDRAALASLMEDLRGGMREEAPLPPGPDMAFKKQMSSEARLLRYTGSEAHVSIPREILLDGARLRVTSISDSAFARNAAVREASLPDGVRTIGRYAFFGCSSLESVELPPSLRAIGDGAFCRCSSLESVDLPSGLEKIGDQAFLGCPLETVFLPDSVSQTGRHSFPPGTRLKGHGIRRSAS